MIAEQDFILILRRLHRLNTAQTVIHVIRHLADHSAVESDGAETAVKDLAKKIGAQTHVMSNGDIFLVLPQLGEERGRELKANLAALVAVRGMESDDLAALYQLPRDYTALREKANSYAELARAGEVVGPVRQAEAALQAADVRGALTAYSLAQVEKLLDNIDIKRYVRTQPVYKQDAQSGLWEKRFIDFYISISDLKRERFPRLNLATPERLFLELCYTLDRKLLLELAGQVDHWFDKHISLNLSAETVLSAAFAQFCHALPNNKRHQVNFEIHCCDLFLNFTTTRNAINILRSEGFGVGIDGITPTVLPYINFALLDTHYYKINVAREKWPDGMDQAAVQRTLQTLPVEKIIFSHCDHEEALRVGQNYGVRSYQGWLIDDVVSAIPH